MDIIVYNYLYIRTFIPIPVPPAPPASLAASDITQNSICITWEQVAESVTPIDSYIIEVQKGGEDKFHHLAEVSAGQTSYVAEQLCSDTPYQFAVKAKNTAGESERAVMLPEIVTTACTEEVVAVGMWIRRAIAWL